MKDNTHAASTSHWTCQKVTEAIIDYISGVMDSETAGIFEAHLRGCTDCTAFMNTYTGTLRVTRSLSYEQLPNEMRHRVRQFLHKTIHGFPSPGC